MKATIISTRHKSVVLSYAAAISKLILGILLLPVVMIKLPANELAFWVISSTLIGLIQLFDFGFGPTFARNLTAIVSGANKLKVSNLEKEKIDEYVNVILLQKTVFTISRFYKKLALISLIFSILFSIIYSRISTVSLGQNSTTWIVIFAYIYIFVSTSGINVRALGYGLISEEKKSVIVQNLIVSVIGLSAIYYTGQILFYFVGMLIGLIIQRVILSSAITIAGFENEISELEEPKESNFEIIGPNAVRSGLTSISGFLATRGSILIAGFYLSELSIGYLGVVISFFGIISQLSKTYTLAHQPEMTQLFVLKKVSQIMRIFVISNLMIIISFSFIIFGSIIIGLDRIIILLDIDLSISDSMIYVLGLIFMLEAFHSNSASFILATNYVPFVVPSVLTLILMLILCWFNMSILRMAEWGYVLAIGVSQLLYQNWKWPSLAYNLIKSEHENSVNNP